MQAHSQAYGRVSERKGEADRGGGDGMARAMQKVEKLVEENAVVVFSESGCCMCHVVKRLFCSLGVGPTVYELDEQSGGADMEKALMRLEGKTTAVPTVFVGGKLLGGLDTVMASHLSGNLVPRLKEAGALWLWHASLVAATVFVCSAKKTTYASTSKAGYALHCDGRAECPPGVVNVVEFSE